ncbi:hypothetical protein [Microbulbifer rhizosphaerae]|uniref:Uncharacterized protein n=1 Tax=Microbulbifer rhizosphaerae TaxID=1562603 RepID=A0A7W4WAS3_9GAMM|nr:hypothetical protein [Microbulbifer rhizosphaerae]MBB3060840.1 hypothetical protein [Microbulbifer rhizosphaerae]
MAPCGAWPIFAPAKSAFSLGGIPPSMAVRYTAAGLPARAAKNQQNHIFAKPVLGFALRVSLRLTKIAPGDFVRQLFRCDVLLKTWMFFNKT